MCNHYRKSQKLTDEFMRFVTTKSRKVITPLLDPDFPEHTYPKSLAPVLIETAGEQSFVSMRWGVLIPIQGKLKPVTNARDDKLTGFSWRYATAERRCLIPATSYFEPGTGPEGARGELLFTVKERPAFFFAGVWNPDAEGSDERGFAMVTTSPNDYVRPFHDRMPVVLTDEEADEWIGDEPLAPNRLKALCRGLPSEALLHTVIPANPKEQRPAKLSITKKGTKATDDDQPTLL